MHIDAHCHLADPRLAPELDAIIARSRAAGVTGWIQGGTDPADWDRQLKIRDKFGAGVMIAFGLHPWWAALLPDDTTLKEALTLFEKLLPETQGIGELGLDKAPRFAPTLARQLTAFREQLRIIKGAGAAGAKPLIIHAVRAHGPILDELKAAGPHPAGGMVHHFSGSYDVARQYLDRGFVLSIGGSFSREGFKALKEALPRLPLDRLVIESDSPDGAMENGRLNEPAQLPEIAGAVATALKMDRDELLARSTATLKRLFGL